MPLDLQMNPMELKEVHLGKIDGRIVDVQQLIRDKLFVRGTYSSCKPYNDSTKLASITLKPLDEAVRAHGAVPMEFRFIGDWAQRALKVVDNKKAIVWIQLVGGKAVPASSENALPGKENERVFRTPVIEFKKGVKLYVEGDDHDQDAPPDELTWRTFSPVKAPKASAEQGNAEPSGSRPEVVKAGLQERGLNAEMSTSDAPQGKKRSPAPTEPPPTKKQRKGWGLTIKQRGEDLVYSTLDQIETFQKATRGLNFICGASTFMQVTKARGTDYYTSLKLHDPSLKLSDSDTFITCTLFGNKESDLPPALTKNQVLVLRSVNWDPKQSRLVGYADGKKAHAWAVLDSDALKGPERIIHPKIKRYISMLETDEVDLARRLHAHLATVKIHLEDEPCAQSFNAAEQSEALRKTKPTSMRRMVTVSEVCETKFYDLVVEVLHIRLSDLDHRADQPGELMVTDYTKHTGLWDYTIDSPFPSNGHVGQHIMKVEVSGYQNLVLKNIRLGTIVYLRNARVKIGTTGILEVSIWPDYRHMDKSPDSLKAFCDVRLYDDYWSQDMIKMAWNIKERKKIYSQALQEGRPLEALNAVNPSTSASAPVPPSASKPAPVRAPEPRQHVAPSASRVETSHTASTAVLASPASAPTPYNHRIHCTLDKPVSEMKDVIAQNAPGVYKFRAKVIDFYPKQMMDWIVAYCDSCEEGKQLSPGESLCDEHAAQTPTLYVHCLLYLQDASIEEEEDFIPVAFGFVSETSKLVPGLRLLPAMRDPIQPGTILDPIRERFGTVLGDLESSKRCGTAPERQPQYFDVAVEAVVSPGSPELRYRFAEKSMTFYPPI